MARSAAPAGVPPPRRTYLLRSLALGSLFEVILVTAVVSMLAIRGLLALTGFPRLGGGGLHIAHLLWGGLLMLAGLLLLLGFVGRPIQYAAALVAGAGFGTFIDELGKFLTADNDYFFRPAVAIVYALFVLLFIAGRALDTRRRFTDRELLANAFDLAREATLYRRRPAHSTEVLAFLEAHAGHDPLLERLRDAVVEAESLPWLAPAWVRRLERRGLHLYARAVDSRWLARLLVAGFAVYGLAGAAVVALSITLHGAAPGDSGRTDMVAVGAAASGLLALLLIVMGLVRLPWSRPDAFRWFRRAVLVNLLLTQLFQFYTLQFWALIGVGVDVVLLVLLNGLNRAERRVARGAHRPAAARPAPADAG